MELYDENGRKTVEYTNSRGAKVYTDAEKYIKGHDFSDELNLPDNPTDQQLEDAKGLSGFEQLTQEKKEKHIRNEVLDLV